MQGDRYIIVCSVHRKDVKQEDLSASTDCWSILNILRCLSRRVDELLQAWLAWQPWWVCHYPRRELWPSCCTGLETGGSWWWMFMYFCILWRSCPFAWSIVLNTVVFLLKFGTKLVSEHCCAQWFHRLNWRIESTPRISPCRVSWRIHKIAAPTWFTLGMVSEFWLATHNIWLFMGYLFVY